MNNRRRFLAGSGLATLGILGGCADTGYRFSRDELVDLYRRSADHLRDFLDAEESAPYRPEKPRPLPNEATYRDYLATIRLDHISPEEVIRPHRNIRSGVANSLPPRHLWSNLKPTLQVADEIRRRLGVKLTYINSVYRSPGYNAVCSGASKRSYHLKNLAMDLMFDCTPEDAATMAKKIRAEGRFRGGIGVYSSFIHIDTRGYDATWG